VEKEGLKLENAKLKLNRKKKETQRPQKTNLDPDFLRRSFEKKKYHLYFHFFYLFKIYFILTALRFDMSFKIRIV
jgi:hypothetical protein